MKALAYLIPFGILLFSVGCSDGPSRHDDPGHTEHGHAENAAGLSTATVTLDDGQRWKANPETTIGMANMVALIEEQMATPGDPMAMKAALEEEFGLIFERCTMTGEAHNQLHNYLIPIHQRLSGFDASDAAQLAEMKDYLGTYGDYFE